MLQNRICFSSRDFCIVEKAKGLDHIVCFQKGSEHSKLEVDFDLLFTPPWTCWVKKALYQCLVRPLQRLREIFSEQFQRNSSLYEAHSSKGTYWLSESSRAMVKVFSPALKKLSLLEIEGACG